MKKFLKNKLNKFFKTKSSVFFKEKIISLNKYIQLERQESAELLKKLFENKVVLTGIFKGMKYPELNAYGSALYPKIIGSYEKELYPTLERLLQKNYSEIVDIGCAEGYYAVGLALKTNNNTKIWAYDTDEKALNFCRQMAKINLVENKIIFGGLCTPEILAKFSFTNGLVICDCEGYENELFTPASIKTLINCDAIIELHEFIVPDILKKITDLFAPTHNYSLITTNFWLKHEPRNPNEYNNYLSGLNYETKKLILEECRPCQMRWLILEKK